MRRVKLLQVKSLIRPVNRLLVLVCWLKGTTNGVISDIDGNFSLQGVAENATIQIRKYVFLLNDINYLEIECVISLLFNLKIEV